MKGWLAARGSPGTGRGILSPGLDARDYFSARVTWLWMLEPTFSGTLKSGFDLASRISTSRTLTLPALGVGIPFVCKHQVAEETVFLRGWKAGS